MTTVIKTTFKLRRDKSVEWRSKNPILADGEPAVETDSGNLKVGDGVSRWNELAYSTSEPLPGDPPFADLYRDVIDPDYIPPEEIPDDDPISFELLYLNAKV